MEEVLNRALYKRLERRFGHVKVSNSQQAMVCKSVKTGDDELKPKLLISHAGEYYKICCPFCRDTRYRMYVNHRFGQLDAYKRPLLFLAICYNEGCLSNRDNFKAFLEMLDEAYLSEARVVPGKVVSEEAQEVMPVGTTIALNMLHRTHPARLYVESRGFNVDVLANRYGVTYCTSSRYSLATDRLNIPVFEKGKLKGWQARFAGELDWKGPNKKELPPKYFNTPEAHFRSRCIYNIDNMCRWETGVLVEGVTGCWRFGPMAGAIFGNSMSEAQKRKFLSVFRKRTAILLLDPEEFESNSTKKLVSEMKKHMPGNFCAVRLPTGTDPGLLGREFQREFVRQEALKQGVVVRYRMVDEKEAKKWKKKVEERKEKSGIRRRKRGRRTLAC